MANRWDRGLRARFVKEPEGSLSKGSMAVCEVSNLSFRNKTQLARALLQLPKTALPR